MDTIAVIPAIKRNMNTVKIAAVGSKDTTATNAAATAMTMMIAAIPVIIRRDAVIANIAAATVVLVIL